MYTVSSQSILPLNALRDSRTVVSSTLPQFFKWLFLSSLVSTVPLLVCVCVCATIGYRRKYVSIFCNSVGRRYIARTACSCCMHVCRSSL